MTDLKFRIDQLPAAGTLTDADLLALEQNVGSGNNAVKGTLATIKTYAQNFNLTGPITSVGTATSIASQTGTGSKIVVDTNPTLVGPIIGGGVFANRPGSPATGQQYLATDLGTGIYIFYDGTKWKPLNGIACLYTSGTASSNVTGGTSETAVLNFRVFANLLSANGHLEIELITNNSNSASAKTSNVRASATTGTTGTTYNTQANTTNTTARCGPAFIIANNSTAAQKAAGVAQGFGGTTPAITSTVDTTVDWFLNFTITLASGADTASLQWARILWVEP